MRKVIWAVDVEASSQTEAAGRAMEIAEQGFGTATLFRVDGDFVNMEGDEPSTNRPSYDGLVICSRADLIAAFTRWHAECEKNPDGSLKGATPDDPEAQADILLGHLKAG